MVVRSIANLGRYSRTRLLPWNDFGYRERNQVPAIGVSVWQGQFYVDRIVVTIEAVDVGYNQGLEGIWHKGCCH